MITKFFTIVFEVEDSAEFSKFTGEVIHAMGSETLYRGAKVTGAGWDDAMTRADNLVALCEEEGVTVPEELQ